MVNRKENQKFKYQKIQEKIGKIIKKLTKKTYRIDLELEKEIQKKYSEQFKQDWKSLGLDVVSFFALTYWYDPANCDILPIEEEKEHTCFLNKRIEKVWKEYVEAIKNVKEFDRKKIALAAIMVKELKNDWMVVTLKNTKKGNNESLSCRCSLNPGGCGHLLDCLLQKCNNNNGKIVNTKRIKKIRNLHKNIFGQSKYKNFNFYYIGAPYFDTTSANKKKFTGVLVVCQADKGSTKEEQDENIDKLTSLASLFFSPAGMLDMRLCIQKQLLRNASVAIIIDSFAHNIAAHSLVRFLNFLDTKDEWHIKVFRDIVQKMDRLKKLLNPENVDKILTGIDEIITETTDPICNEYGRGWCNEYLSLKKYLEFLKDKATFWNGLISEIYVFYGTRMSLYDILAQLLANHLFIGTIAEDLGVTGINLFVNGTNWGGSSLDDYNFPYVPYCPYAKNRYFNCTKKILDYEPISEDMNTNKLEEVTCYLPGGIIALHAFYTIVENIIRNIKWSKNINGPIIDLHIHFKEQTPFYEFNIGIDCECDTKNITEDLINPLNSSILDSNTSIAIKGGISQSKICAVIIRGFELIRVDQPVNSIKPSLIKIDEKKLKKNKIFWKFHMWQAVLSVLFDKNFVEKIKKGKENPYRAKFILVPQTEEELFIDIDKSKLPMRVVKLPNKNNPIINNEEALYKEWLNNWLEGGNYKILPEGKKSLFKKYVFCLKKKKGDFTFKVYHFGDSNDYKKAVAENLILARGHYIFKNQFVNEDNKIKAPTELIETLATKIDIVDNELFTLWKKICNKYEKSPQAMQTYTYATLFLRIVKEERTKKKIDTLMKDGNHKHIFIVHLAMIDAIYGKTDKERNNFVSNALKYYKYIVLTTGRGREEAYANLDKHNKEKTKFIYRSEFENCFRVALEEHGEEIFSLKYFLVKKLLGG